jgi:hypothetical protein
LEEGALLEAALEGAVLEGEEANRKIFIGKNLSFNEKINAVSR